MPPHDAPDYFKKLGIDVFLGNGHFKGSDQLQVGDQTLNFKKALIVTGTEGISIDSIIIDMADVDRAILDGETMGFAKLLVKSGTF